MAILVIEPVKHSRETLKSLLSYFCAGQVIAVKSENEACDQIRANGNRFDFVIGSDAVLRPQRKWEELAIKHLDPHAGVVLLSSGYRNISAYRRVDCYLSKPLRRRRLARGMGRAYANRCRFRNRILIWQKSPSFELTESDLVIGNTTLYPLQVTTAEEFESSLKKLQSEIGMILIDPATFEAQADTRLESWLKSMKRSTWGMHTYLTCLGRDGGVPQFLRLFSDAFIDCEEWGRNPVATLQLLQKRMRGIWFTRSLLAMSKRSLREGKLREATHLVKISLRFEKKHWGAYSLLGDLYSKRGKNRRATGFYRKAIEIAPFEIHPYARLLKILRNQESAELPTLIEMAKSFCGGNRALMRLISLSLLKTLQRSAA